MISFENTSQIYVIQRNSLNRPTELLEESLFLADVGWLNPSTYRSRLEQVKQQGTAQIQFKIAFYYLFLFVFFVCFFYHHLKKYAELVRKRPIYSILESAWKYKLLVRHLCVFRNSYEYFFSSKTETFSTENKRVFY